jgi:hypothetical protein
VTDRGGSSIQLDLRVKVKGKPEAAAIKNSLKNIRIRKNNT